MHEPSPVPPPARFDRLARQLQEVSPGARVHLVGASGGLAALALSALHQRLGRPLVVVAPDDRAAQELADGLRFYLPAPTIAQPYDPVVLVRALDHAPFSGMSPSRVHVMDRVTALFRLAAGLDVRATVVSAPALLDRTPPAAALADSAVLLAPGEVIDRDVLLTTLAGLGYHHAPTAEDPGSFATRGGIIDVFSPLYELPLRVDLWGDEIDTLRWFDPQTQRTFRDLDAAAEVAGGPLPDPAAGVIFSPCRDILFTPETTARARRALYDLADTREVPSSRARAVIDDVSAGVLGVGMEELLPAFYDHTETLQHVARGQAPAPRDAAGSPGAETEPLWVVRDLPRCEEALEARWDEVSRRHARALQADERGGALVFDLEAVYLPSQRAARLLAAAPLRVQDLEVLGDASGEPEAAITVRFDAEDNRDLRREIDAATRRGEEHVLQGVAARVRRWRAKGLAVVLCAHTEGGAERLRGLLGHYDLHVAPLSPPLDLARVPELAAAQADVHLMVAPSGPGFRAPELGLVVLDESDLLGRKARRARRRAAWSAEQALATWRDLSEGDTVVHLQHGIGRYLGLEKTVVDGVEADFLVLEYAQGNKLFVPVDRLHMVSKHTGGDGPAPALDKLGGARWQRVSKRARKAARDIAERLLKIYAEREARRGFAASPPGELFERFEAAFPYEETPDQRRAIEEVLEDQQRERPMDRLVCGDVGFGKTEVAMRAAYKAALDGKQVAVLVPTVVLAIQHLETFRERFRDTPVVLDSLTRLHTPAQAREVRQRLASGAVDIVIGTHRLLNKNVKFHDLGLVIVDEEHRFGVTHKERLKEYRASVDVLTLTATPIPRTLHLSMIGLRDISLIQTPPADRLAVRTIVARPREDVIAEAIERELARGGQVFYVHNRVADIDEHAELIRRLVPSARIVVAHGQMGRGQLEETMARFVRGEANVLVATTVIESGLDIPKANTMLIHRADRFGLAQLYQLRGRIGRSSARAYCYLLVPSPAGLSGDAAQRLATLQRFTALGSGFSVASYDLDIRGSGDILGADQSGHIDAVGYEAFLEMLSEAVEDVRRAQAQAAADGARASGAPGASGAPAPDPELKVAVTTRIPERWLPDTRLRLRLYRDLVAASSVPALYDVYQDAVDRFGRAPEEVARLVELMAIKLRAKALGLRAVGFNRHALSWGLWEHGALQPSLVAAFLTGPGARYRLTPDHQLVRPVTPKEWAQGLAALDAALRELENFVSARRDVPKGRGATVQGERPRRGRG